MKKLNLSLEQIDALEKKENFQYQAGDNSLVITNYEDEGKKITAIREPIDDFYANEYFELAEGENDKIAILAYINSYVEFASGDFEEFDLEAVIENVKKWSTF